MDHDPGTVEERRAITREVFEQVMELAAAVGDEAEGVILLQAAMALSDIRDRTVAIAILAINDVERLNKNPN